MDLNFIEKYFRKNPIYYLDSVRYEHQKHSAVKKEENLPSERWIQFWGVIITLLVIPVTIIIARQHEGSIEGWRIAHYFSLIVIESVFLCSLMIAMVWEGFNSFTRDMESGVFETIMITLLEPRKIVWGKFMHVFIHFLKFSLIGFTLLLVISPLSYIHPAIVLILFALNLAAGCYLISHRIYSSACEAFHKARRKIKATNINEKRKLPEIPIVRKVLMGVEQTSVFVILVVVFLQAQTILLTNYVGKLPVYTNIFMLTINAHPGLFLIHLFLISIVVLLSLAAFFYYRTEQIIGDII